MLIPWFCLYYEYLKNTFSWEMHTEVFRDKDTGYKSLECFFEMIVAPFIKQIWWKVKNWKICSEEYV